MSTRLPSNRVSSNQITLIHCLKIKSLQRRYNGRDGVSNHQPHDCLLNYLFRRRSRKTSKLRVTGLCAGNSPVTGEFPAQMASNAENVAISWRHNENHCFVYKFAPTRKFMSCRRAHPSRTPQLLYLELETATLSPHFSSVSTESSFIKSRLIIKIN